MAEKPCQVGQPTPQILRNVKVPSYSVVFIMSRLYACFLMFVKFGSGDLIRFLKPLPRSDSQRKCASAARNVSPVMNQTIITL